MILIFLSAYLLSVSINAVRVLCLFLHCSDDGRVVLLTAQFVQSAGFVGVTAAAMHSSAPGRFICQPGIISLHKRSLMQSGRLSHATPRWDWRHCSTTGCGYTATLSKQASPTMADRLAVVKNIGT